MYMYLQFTSYLKIFDACSGCVHNQLLQSTFFLWMAIISLIMPPNWRSIAQHLVVDVKIIKNCILVLDFKKNWLNCEKWAKNGRFRRPNRKWPTSIACHLINFHIIDIMRNWYSQDSFNRYHAKNRLAIGQTVTKLEMFGYKRNFYIFSTFLINLSIAI